MVLPFMCAWDGTLLKIAAVTSLFLMQNVLGISIPPNTRVGNPILLLVFLYQIPAH